MTTYFNPNGNSAFLTGQNDPAMLPVAVRNHPDMVMLAGISEADIIDYYTETPSYWWLATSQLGFIQYPWGWGGLENPGVDISANQTTAVKLRVYLKGFRPDVNNTTGTGSTDPLVDLSLASALRRTVAWVLAWRLHQWKNWEPGESSVSAEVGKSRTFKATAEDAFPPDWNRALFHFANGRAIW